MEMTQRSVGILPLGEVPGLVLKIMAAHILAYADLPAKILPSLETPHFALDKRRLQYDAGGILKMLESRGIKGCTKVVAVMDQDLFVPVFTHVYGEARQGGNMALVSLFRLDKNPDGSTPASSLFYERAAKIALHELGHLFDLFHCNESTCLMHFSGDLEDLDRSSFSFCRHCSVGLRFHL
ncbi:archaemetzincin family Zn-dependent metalloprotease [Desulfospira joergensenii]|uniref:archaemetzincin family Zn-dependent metalloprotease n=1 Tax=Desulfospira joergensenii TaxID=53329 RepID=UPI0003B3B1C3|nr:archaemetzincin family Zn-dependent metalloprotease [Desulfospira joergensenii]